MDLGRKSVALRADLAVLLRFASYFWRLERLGRLDLLVNSAANFFAGKCDFDDGEIWDASLDTNVKARFSVRRQRHRCLRRTKGSIVNFADTGGCWAGRVYFAFSFEAGMVMLTKCLAKALARMCVVNAIAPGTITMAAIRPEWEAEFVKLSPLRKRASRRMLRTR